MSSRSRRLVCTCILVALLAVLATPGIAAAAAPLLSIELSPASSDGSNGWYRTDPEAYAIVDQDAVLHYDWGAGETTAALAAGVPLSIGFAPEGAVALASFAVNGGGESSSPSTITIKTDTQAPSQPTGLLAAPSPGQISVTWNDVSDATSDLGYYTVYRNLSGPPFSASDVIASVTATSYTDAPGAGGVWYYAVRATDRAGNDSLMSDAVHASADVDAPSTPGNVQAWRNGRGFIRVSWTEARDTGTGVAYYTIFRSVGGAGRVVVGTAPSGARHFDDPDPEAYAADDDAYTVRATDWAGNVIESIAVQAGTDMTAPVKPAPPTVVPFPGVGGLSQLLGSDMLVTLADVADLESGIVRYEITYGEDADHPRFAYSMASPQTFVAPSGGELADYFFLERVEDRAGNLSEWSDPVEHRAVTVGRISGSDRIHTSLAAARAGFPGPHAAVFASAYSFPDALAASGLAGALEAPVILVGPGPLPADTRAALADLGVSDGYVVGGPPAVSAATFRSIAAALSGETTRVAGPDRYRTAAAVASAVERIAGKPSRVFLVSGVAFPDALSVGPAAFSSASPVLFATPSAIPQPTLDSMRALGVTSTVIVGGTSAVWSGAEARVTNPTRVYGPDRYATSLAFARWAGLEGVLRADRPVLVTGAAFPDGLSAGALAGSMHSPILLVRQSSLGPARTFLGEHLREVQRVNVVGSGLVISDTVMYDAWKLFSL